MTKISRINSIKEEIEKSVRARDLDLAFSLIKKFLNANTRSLAAQKQACAWSLRLGSYIFGYRCTLSMTRKRDQALWCAFFLNAMGANELALDLLGKVKPETAEELYLTANVFLGNYRFEESKALTQKLFENEKYLELNPYTQKLAKITLADSYSCLRNPVKAIEVIKTIQADSSEALLQGILLQAEGEYLCTLEEWPSALSVLSEARLRYPARDQSPDYAFLLKWLAYAEGKNGNLKNAQQYFDQALLILSKPEYRDEMRLEVQRLRNDLNLLNPKEVEELLFFPGLTKNFLDRIPVRKTVASLRINFGSQKENLFRISLCRQEVQFKGKRYPAVERTEHLIALIVLSAPSGLHVERAKGLLWPSEGLSYLMLEKRLESLIQAITKRFELKVQVKNRRLKIISGTTPIEIEAFPGTDIFPPAFLTERNHFTMDEMKEYYTGSERTLRESIKRWKDRNWIRAGRKNGKPIYYVTLLDI